jgi:hypothetical protein
MNRFGIPDSVLASVRDVLNKKPIVEVETEAEEAEDTVTPQPVALAEGVRQLKDPKKEVMMGYKVPKTGKVKISVHDKEKEGDKLKKGYFPVESVGLQTFKKRTSVTEKKHLDPVDHKDLKGSHADRKDKDIDNDGKVDDTDTYLHNRRKTVKKAMKEGSDTKEYTSPGLRKKHAQDVQKADAAAMMASAKQGNRPEKKGRYGGNMSSEEVIDELSVKTLGSYVSKASNAKGHKELSTKKVDNRYDGVKKASDKLEEEDIEEGMAMSLKPHGTAGTHYTVHKIGKKLAKHGGIKVGDKLSDTHVDDARDSGIRVKHVNEDSEEGFVPARQRLRDAILAVTTDKSDVSERDELLDELEDIVVKEAAPLPTEKQKATTERIKARAAAKKSMAESFKSGDAVTPSIGPHKGVKHEVIHDHGDGSYNIKPMGLSPKQNQYKLGAVKAKAEHLKLHEEEETVSESVGDEKVRSSAQASSLAKHYYQKAKSAQTAGDTVGAGKMMSAAKKFYRASEEDQAQEKGGQQVAAAESTVGEFYFNELEIEELSAPDIEEAAARKNSGAKVGETERSGHRVTKTAKEGPEHIVMQARKVISVGKNHSGVEFADGKKEKVHPNHARQAIDRYNSAKPSEKSKMQDTMNHSHAGLKHVASGGDLDHHSNPAHKSATKSALGNDTRRRGDKHLDQLIHPDSKSNDG